MLLVFAVKGPSSIHGDGLISQQFIPEGSRVWELRSGFDLEFTANQLNQLSPPARQQVLYYCDGDFDPVSGIYTLSMDDARFTNHSDTPNTASAEEGRVTVATRDIYPGEEITWDYRTWLGKNVGNLFEFAKP